MKLTRPSTIRKKADKNYRKDTSSISITRVPINKSKPNPQKGHLQKTAIHHGTQSYFVLCKKAGYPESRYKYHSSDN